MKPTFTSSGNAFMQQVRTGLIAPFSAECRWILACFPAFGTGSFSLQFVEEDSPFLLMREWNPAANTAFPLGVHLYDLNNILIPERRIALSESDSRWIAEIGQLDWRVQKSDGIMLDGVEYVFIAGKKTIRWTFIDTLSPELEAALNKLSVLAGFNR